MPPPFEFFRERFIVAELLLDNVLIEAYREHAILAIVCRRQRYHALMLPKSRLLPALRPDRSLEPPIGRGGRA
jgi:hypothetical protein